MRGHFLRAWMLAAVVQVFMLPMGAWALPAEVMQEGIAVDAQGAPLDGAHRIVVRVYAQPAGGAPLFEEIHNGVELFDGYYALAIGSINALDAALFARDALYVGLAFDAGPELAPRVSLRQVPAAMHAQQAQNAVGDITPRSVAIPGVGVVIDGQGRWVGPAVLPGGGGDPLVAETPQTILAKLRQVDGAASGLDADLLDGFNSAAFLRTAGQVLAKLITVDGTGSGIDADRLDGHDSAVFVRTAAQVLALLRTVDGAGSGVDADRLDGVDSAALMRGDQDTGTAGTLTVGGGLRVTGASTLTGALSAGEVRVGARLGVGVANPQAEVHVDGTVKATSIDVSTLKLSPLA